MKKPTCRPGPRRSSYKTVLKYNQLLGFIRKLVSILRGDSGTHSCPRLGPRDMQVMSSAVGPAANGLGHDLHIPRPSSKDSCLYHCQPLKILTNFLIKPRSWLYSRTVFYSFEPGERAGIESGPPPTAVTCLVTSLSRLVIDTCFHARWFPIFEEYYLYIAFQVPPSSDDEGKIGSTSPGSLPPPQQARLGKIG